MNIFTVAGHLTEDCLILDAIGDLEESQQRRSQAHLSRCQSCRAEHRSIAMSIVLLKSDFQKRSQTARGA